MKIENTKDSAAKDKIKELSAKWKLTVCPHCGGEFNPFSALFRVSDMSGDSPVIGLMQDDCVCDAICDSYEVDADGFLIGMTDSLGNSTDEKICPCCRNTLEKDYGKYPIVRIPVIGPTRTGKTVYLRKLIDNIDRYISEIGYNVCRVCEVGRLGTDPVRKGEMLPHATMVGMQPSTITVTISNAKSKEGYTLVFYDLPGECISSSYYDKLIFASDGYLAVTDAARDDSDFSEMLEILRTRFVRKLNDIALSSKNDGKVNKALAVIFSKADSNDDLLSIAESASDDRDNFDVFSQIDADDDMMIAFIDTKEPENSKTLLKSLAGQYDRLCYFSVAPLGGGAVIDSDNKLVECTEPLKVEYPLYWLLYQMGVIPKKVITEVKKGLFKKKTETVEKYSGNRPEYGGMK